MYIITILFTTGRVQHFWGDKTPCMRIAHELEKAQLENPINKIASICVEDALDLDAAPCFETYC